jgi:mannose-6-phosphate isomerase class I
MEIPWNTFFHLEYDSVMGNIPKRRFAGQFPIRYDYLDTMQGGDLSIQVHPTTPYIRRQFGEPYHQGEMYYIVEARSAARVNVGLKDGIDKDAFHRAARAADKQHIPFDYREFVSSVPSSIHDLILIPPGTVHGSGEGQVVLEISATTYRYTFKIYDHLRPDLDGRMRPIHIDHAFRVIKWHCRTTWVGRHLVQKPVLVRSGPGWAEYKIGDRPEFFHVVFRLEFKNRILDRTRGRFHILTLVEGQSVRIESSKDPNRCLILRYSETAVVPAVFGEYRIVNLGNIPCKIAKARLRTKP